MTIAVDIDEVLFPLKKGLYEYINQRFGTSYDWRNSHYNLGVELGLSYEERVQIYFDFLETEIFRKTRPISDSVSGIEKIAKLGKLYAVTSRQEVLREDTERFLDKYFRGKFSGLEMGNHINRGQGVELSKIDMCRKIGAELLIEDQIKYVVEVSERIPVIVFSQPWNQNLRRKNTFRAESWKEVVGLSRGIINGKLLNKV